MRNLLQASEERIYFKDRDSRFILASRGFALSVTPGTSVDELIGKSDFDLFSNEHAVPAFEDEQRMIRTGEPIVGKIERETFHDRPDAWVSTTKLPLRDDEGRIVGTFGISRDVTAQVRAEEALAYQALHDPVTGLVNRIAFMDRLSQALLALDRSHGRLGLLFIDLDNFKTINDSFGHGTGDRVLIEAGRRLGQVARSGDTVARFGGDEFALLCNGLHEGSDVAVIARRALEALAGPFPDPARDFRFTASIGITVTANPQADAGELLIQADVAMYEAKAAGRNCFRIYDPSRHAPDATWHDFGTSLRQAIEAGELFVVYQPLFSLEDRSLRGAEALVRWHHPQQGVILPADFMPLAEERGLIGLVDAFVLDEACRQLSEWLSLDQVPPDFTVAVNLSARQLTDPSLAGRIASTLKRHKLPPWHLCIEMTEASLIGRLEDAELALGALSHMGVRLALDDFGTCSTLSYLRRLRVDMLKIDRHFVSQIAHGRNRDVIASIAAIAHALGMAAVGVGIEEESQMVALAATGYDQGQGFFLAEPLLPDDLPAVCSPVRSPSGFAARPGQAPLSR